MVHQRQRLPLGLEAGDHLPRVHAGLDDLERHLAADRLVLLGHVDDAHAPFADLLQQLVGADDCAGALGNRLTSDCGNRRLADDMDAARVSVGMKKPDQPELEVRSPAARLVQECRASCVGARSMAFRNIERASSSIAVMEPPVALSLYINQCDWPAGFLTEEKDLPGR